MLTKFRQTNGGKLWRGRHENQVASNLGKSITFVEAVLMKQYPLSRCYEAGVFLASLPKGEPQELPEFKGSPDIAAVKRAIKRAAQRLGMNVKIVSASSKEHYVWRLS
jgi:hypothetical protein